MNGLDAQTTGELISVAATSMSGNDKGEGDYSSGFDKTLKV